MKRSDLQFRDGRPAVNVKIHTGYTELARAIDRLSEPGAGSEWAGLGMTHAWIEAHTTEAERSAAWDRALEDGWRALQDDAWNLFGPGRATVYAAGRSRGWAVIRELTREHTETWDAIALGRWAQWARYCRETCAGRADRYAWIIYQAHFLPARDRAAARARFAAAATAALCEGGI